MSVRPVGVDPGEPPVPVVVGDLGTFLLGFVPRGKLVLLQGAQRAVIMRVAKLLTQYERTETDGRVVYTIPEGFDHEAQTKVQEDAYHRHADLCRWIVKGWLDDTGLPPCVLAREEYCGHTYDVLGHESSELLAARDIVAPLAEACLEFWTLTPLEKKSSESSASPAIESSAAAIAE